MKNEFTVWWKLIRGSIIPVVIASALAILAAKIATDASTSLWLLLGSTLCLTSSIYTMLNYVIPKVIAATAPDDPSQFAWHGWRWLLWVCFTLCVLLNALVLYMAVQA